MARSDDNCSGCEHIRYVHIGRYCLICRGQALQAGTGGDGKCQGFVETIAAAAVAAEALSNV